MMWQAITRKTGANGEAEKVAVYWTHRRPLQMIWRE